MRYFVTAFSVVLCCSLASASLAAEELPSAAPELKGRLRGAFYSETFYDKFRDLFTNSSRFRLLLPLNEVVTPYIVIGDELVAPIHNAAIKGYHPWSHYYGGAGLRLSIPGVELFLEGRQRVYHDRDDADAAHLAQYENRALLVLSYWWDHPSSLGGVWFADTYGEALLTSYDADNVVMNGYVRFGQRTRLATGLTLDSYLRPYAVRDQQGEPMQSRNEIEAGLRLNAMPTWCDVSVGTAYVHSKTLPAKKDGYEHDYQQGWRFYLILGRNVP